MQMIASSSSGSRMRSRTLTQRSASAMPTVPSPMNSAGVIGLVDVRQRQPEPLEKMILAGAGRRQSQQVLELIEHQQHRRAEREADDHRVRNVARQVAQPQQRDAGLNRRPRSAPAESRPEFARHR